MTPQYPSGGNYPETKADFIEHLIRLCQNATPEQMQAATRKCMQRGGKFAVFAQLVMGEIDIKEFGARLDKAQ